MSEARPTSAEPASRAARLDKVLSDLRTKAPEIEAAAVVSFDGLPMVSDLPAGMDEDRVAAMCAALLSLGERAAEGLGRGLLNQVYIEGETGTVFLVACDEEAVLVAVAAKGAKVGMMLYEVRRGAQAIADVLAEDAALDSIPTQFVVPEQSELPSAIAAPTYVPTYAEPAPVTAFIPEAVEAPAPSYAPAQPEPAADASGWSSYAPSGEPTPWS